MKKKMPDEYYEWSGDFYNGEPIGNWEVWPDEGKFEPHQKAGYKAETVNLDGFAPFMANRILESWMAHPDSKIDRDIYMAMGHAMHAEETCTALPQSALTLLNDAFRNGYKDGFEASVKFGRMAGSVLLAMHDMIASGIAKPTLDMAHEIVRSNRVADASRIYGQKRYQTAYKSDRPRRGQNSREAVRKDAWQPYRHVAHIWAAHELLDREPIECCFFTGRCTTVDKSPARVAATAMALLELCDQHKSAGLSGEIMPSDALTLEGFEPVTLPPFMLSDRDKGHLESFKPRNHT